MRDCFILGTVISTSDGHVQHHMTSKPTNTALDQHVQDNSALAQEDDRLIKDMGLEVGSMVEVPMTNNRSQHGVIRWIGKLPELKNRLVAGLELVRQLLVVFEYVIMLPFLSDSLVVCIMYVVVYILCWLSQLTN